MPTIMAWAPWRMPDDRLPKKVLFSQLSHGKRPQHKPKVRWRDCITNDLKDTKLFSMWTDLALTRPGPNKTWP